MIRLYFIAGLLLMLFGCADNVELVAAATMEPVGFWYGMWHGFIVLWSFGGSLFFDDIAIYAVYNNGAMYDFGFIVGIVILIVGYDNAND